MIQHVSIRPAVWDDDDGQIDPCLFLGATFYST